MKKYNNVPWYLNGETWVALSKDFLCCEWEQYSYSKQVKNNLLTNSSQFQFPYFKWSDFQMILALSVLELRMEHVIQRKEKIQVLQFIIPIILWDQSFILP